MSLMENNRVMAVGVVAEVVWVWKKKQEMKKGIWRQTRS